MEDFTFILALVFDVCKKICAAALYVFYSVPSIFYFVEAEAAVHAFIIVKVYLIAFERFTIGIPPECSVFLQRYVFEFSRRHIGLRDFTVCRHVPSRAYQDRAETQYHRHNRDHHTSFHISPPAMMFCI